LRRIEVSLAKAARDASSNGAARVFVFTTNGCCKQTLSDRANFRQ
jgi:hypothetical protein